MLFVDEAALTADTEDALQLLIGCFEHACKEFGLSVILKKTNILAKTQHAKHAKHLHWRLHS